MSRADYESFIAHFYHLCTYIGVNPASRALGISEERGRKIASRRKFGISRIRAGALHPNALKSRIVTGGIEATQNIVQHYSDRAKIGATIAGAKAMEHLADAPAEQLVKPANSIAADQWTKAVDRAAGWTQARAAGVNVGVQVNITPPSEAERAERRAVHAQLDEITRLLSQSSE